MRVTNFAAAASIAAAMLALGACDRTRPILNIHDEPIPPRGASLDEIGREITIAAGSLHWRITEAAPGHLVAKINAQDHEASVDIAYTGQNYSITLKDTANLLQNPDGTIHRRYDSWIANLRDKIDLQLAAYIPPKS
jgi:hypothetical protein